VIRAVRLAAIASLSVIGVSICAGTAAAAERWDLVAAPGGPYVSSHSSWADCSRAADRRGQTLDRWRRSDEMRGRPAELLSPSFFCIPAPQGSPTTRSAQSPATRARWVLWRWAPSLNVDDEVPDKIHSRHDSANECDIALLRRYYELGADGPQDLESYRCRPEDAGGTKR
jgi:hypothetical protein